LQFALLEWLLSGRKALLGRKAGKVFGHVKDIIKQASLASSIGQEYSTLLRTHLLPVPLYCNAVSIDSFEGNDHTSCCSAMEEAQYVLCMTVQHV